MEKKGSIRGEPVIEMQRVLPPLKVYPVCEVDLADMPATIGVNKKVGEEVKRWYHQAEDRSIMRWIVGQLQTECHVIITGSVPPWLASRIGWVLRGNPLVKSLTVRASIDKQGFLVGSTFEDDT